MSWDKLENSAKTDAEIKQKQAEIRQAEHDHAKLFHRLFLTEDGKKVYEYLFQRFVMANINDDLLESTNPNYAAAFRNGQANVMKYITDEISKAQTL